MSLQLWGKLWVIVNAHCFRFYKHLSRVCLYTLSLLLEEFKCMNLITDRFKYFHLKLNEETVNYRKWNVILLNVGEHLEIKWILTRSRGLFSYGNSPQKPQSWAGSGPQPQRHCYFATPLSPVWHTLWDGNPEATYFKLAQAALQCCWSLNQAIKYKIFF